MQLGYASRGSAWKPEHRLLNRERAEGAAELRAVEGARLDRLLVVICERPKERSAAQGASV